MTYALPNLINSSCRLHDQGVGEQNTSVTAHDRIEDNFAGNFLKTGLSPIVGKLETRTPWNI